MRIRNLARLLMRERWMHPVDGPNRETIFGVSAEEPAGLSKGVVTAPLPRPEAMCA